MVETPRFHCRGHDWIPYLELRSHMPHSRAKKKRKWVLNPVPKQMLSHVIDLSPVTCRSRMAHLSFPFPDPKGRGFF